MEKRREATSEDGVLTRIGQAIMLHRAGDREEARNRLTALWHEIGPQGDAFHRCTLAHYMADTQDDPRDELDWDLRALEAAEGFVTERPGCTAAASAEPRIADGPGPRHPLVALRAFFPSLHLNIAADYAALDRPADARAQLRRARASVNALADGEYRQGLRDAIDRLQLRIDRAAGHPR
ncbi:hypothetical protein ACFXN2_28615 [Streptomyces kronopolitis]|uniref:Tetratricopeptide repeat protein n=1 Tax=Streptomyces kronopolitis TaxID=1612435 RepID=A0ABQ2JPH0_9ACTN|nr:MULTISPECIES: hypothetical protein [Streptomyces]MCL6298270.1 hypothetical protein [Streptomyces kronopolitis]GGN53338.1 hypothetical protein GCM10012285_45190 [Streptomyces kronopolitis]GLW15033.1 hypothetical protein Stsp01_17760 [Streptomyces sp. NBRC 13847]